MNLHKRVMSLHRFCITLVRWCWFNQVLTPTTHPANVPCHVAPMRFSNQLGCISDGASSAWSTYVSMQTLRAWICFEFGRRTTHQYTKHRTPQAHYNSWKVSSLENNSDKALLLLLKIIPIIPSPNSNIFSRKPSSALSVPRSASTG